MQDNERSMYELEYPAPSVDEWPTLVEAMHGYAEAGISVKSSDDQLKAALESRPLATFNSDELVDYRSRLPAVTIDIDQPVEIESLHLDIRVLKDTEGKPFLLPSGPEPD